MASAPAFAPLVSCSGAVEAPPPVPASGVPPPPPPASPPPAVPASAEPLPPLPASATSPPDPSPPVPASASPLGPLPASVPPAGPASGSGDVAPASGGVPVLAVPSVVDPLQAIARQLASTASRRRMKNIGTSAGSDPTCARSGHRETALIPDRRRVQPRQPRLAILAVHHQRLSPPLRRFEEDVRQHLLEDAAQSPRAQALLHRVLDDRPQRPVPQIERRSVERGCVLVLAREAVRRYGEDLVQLVRGQFRELHLHGEPAEKLGEHSVLDQLLHPQPDVALPAPFGPETDLLVDLRLVQIGEGARADEEDVVRVHLHEVVLVPMLGDVERYEDLAALEELEERLLDALAPDVAAAGTGARASGAPRDLVDLVDEDDPALGGIDGVAALEEQLRDHHLDVLPVVPGLGVLGRVDYREGHFEELGEVAGDVRLPASGRAHEEQVRFAQERLRCEPPLLDALQVLVRRRRHRALGGSLADDVPVEVLEDLPRGEHPQLFARSLLPRTSRGGIQAAPLRPVLRHEARITRVAPHLLAHGSRTPEVNGMTRFPGRISVAIAMAVVVVVLEGLERALDLVLDLRAVRIDGRVEPRGTGPAEPSGGIEVQR